MCSCACSSRIGDVCARVRVRRLRWALFVLVFVVRDYWYPRAVGHWSLATSGRVYLTRLEGYLRGRYPSAKNCSHPRTPQFYPGSTQTPSPIHVKHSGRILILLILLISLILLALFLILLLLFSILLILLILLILQALLKLHVHPCQAFWQAIVNAS